jgi:hypothetical protein
MSAIFLKTLPDGIGNMINRYLLNDDSDIDLTPRHRELLIWCVYL